MVLITGKSSYFQKVGNISCGSSEGTLMLIHLPDGAQPSEGLLEEPLVQGKVDIHFYRLTKLYTHTHTLHKLSWTQVTSACCKLQDSSDIIWWSELRFMKACALSVNQSIGTIVLTEHGICSDEFFDSCWVRCASDSPTYWTQQLSPYLISL